MVRPGAESKSLTERERTEEQLERSEAYMSKKSAPEESINAIRKALAGAQYVSAALTEKLAMDLKHNGARSAR